MSRYILIRRLRGPAFLLLVGINALLAQAHILGWSESWPFYLILAGVISLAERAALATDSGMQQQPYPAAPYPDSSVPPASESTSIVPAHSHDFDNSNGGQS
ncbi:MAG: hypothetical protein ABSF17_06320 [Terracidiphilus sp.]